MSYDDAPVILPMPDRPHAWQPSPFHLTACLLCGGRRSDAAGLHKPSSIELERAAPYAYNTRTHVLRRLSQ